MLGRRRKQVVVDSGRAGRLDMVRHHKQGERLGVGQGHFAAQNLREQLSETRCLAQLLGKRRVRSGLSQTFAHLLDESQL